ncbi:MAG: sporulation transcriptional regulator SpoIIID [Christensenellales bacterium]
MSEKEIEFVANFILEKNLTIRDAGKIFNVPKSTLHYNVTKKLKQFDAELYLKLHAYLQKNFSEKHLRGGNSTKEKYKKLNHKN